MKKVVEYQTEEEKQVFINQNLALYLIEEQNLISGNFLIFSDTPLVVEKLTIIEPVKSEDLIKLQQDNLILMDVLATMYEDMLAKGTV